MQRAARNLSAVLGRVLFIGLSVQMILGLLWMFGNFAFFQEFGESLFLERVSRTLVCDDYTGILYPILIGMARGIASVIPVPYYCFLYLLQLGAGFASAYFFLGRNRAQGRRQVFLRLWGSMVLLTVPAAMQCHLAVLPCSLTGSLLLFQLGVLCRALFEKKEDGSREYFGRTQAILGGLWALEALLAPEYLWFGAVPVLGYAVSGIFVLAGKHLRRAAGIVLVTAAFLGAVPTLSSLTVRPGACGRMENTWEAALLRRTCGGYYAQYYQLWPREISALLEPEEIAECMREQTAISRVMARKVESVFDRKSAKSYYLKMTKSVWEYQKKGIAENFAKDFLGYGFAPALSGVYLRMAYYDSYAGYNYEVMRRHSPKISYYAFAFAGGCFAFGILFAMLRRLAAHLAAREKGGAGTHAAFWFCGGLCVWICLWYSLQGYGVMDGKNSVAVTLLWFVWICREAIESLERVE